MPGTRDQNRGLIRAYGVPIGGYFETLIDNRYTHWSRSSKFMDLQTRPYPRISGNQLDFVSSGWEKSGLAESLGKYADVVFGMNAGPGGMYNEGTANINGLKAARAQTEGWYPNSRYAEINQSRTIYHTKPVYHCPYHRLESIEGNGSAAWAWCENNDGWLRNGSGNIMAYGTKSTTTRRLTQWDLVGWQNYWANTGKVLCADNDFDGFYADNVFWMFGDQYGWSPVNPTNMKLQNGGNPPNLKYWCTAHNNMLAAVIEACTNTNNTDLVILGNSYPILAKERAMGSVEAGPYNPLTNRHYVMDEDWSAFAPSEYGTENFLQCDIKLHVDCRTDEPQSEPVCSNAYSIQAGNNAGPWFPGRMCSTLMTDGIYNMDHDAMTLSTLNAVLGAVGKLGYPLEAYKRWNGSAWVDGLTQSGTNRWKGLFKREFTHGVVFCNTGSTSESVSLSAAGVAYTNLRDCYPSNSNLTQNTVTIQPRSADNSNWVAGGQIYKKLVPSPSQPNEGGNTPPPTPEAVPGKPTGLSVGGGNHGSTTLYEPLPYLYTKTVAWSPTNPRTIIQFPLHWTNPTTGGSILGMQLQMRLQNVPTGHPVKSWENVWYDVKDRWTIPARRGYTTPEYDVFWTELFNEANGRPYEVVIRDAGEPLTPYALSEYPADPSLFIGGLPGSEPTCTTEWRVRLANNTGFSEWSDTYSYAINPTAIYPVVPPPATAPLKPLSFLCSGTTIVDGTFSATFNYTLQASHGATGYRLYAKDPNDVSFNVDLTGVPVASITLKMGTPPLVGTHEYKLALYNATGETNADDTVYVRTTATSVDYIGVTPPVPYPSTQEEVFVSASGHMSPLVPDRAILLGEGDSVGGATIVADPKSSASGNGYSSGSVHIFDTSSLIIEGVSGSNGNIEWGNEWFRRIEGTGVSTGSILIEANQSSIMLANSYSTGSINFGKGSRLVLVGVGTSEGVAGFKNYMNFSGVGVSSGHATVIANSHIAVDVYSSSSGTVRVRYQYRNMELELTDRTLAILELEVL